MRTPSTQIVASAARQRDTGPGRRDVRGQLLQGINRATKDLNVFCKAGDFPRILLHFKEHGFETEVEDERWIAKVRRGTASST